MSEEPLFESTHAALRYALNYSSEQYGENWLGKMQGGSIGSGKGLVGLDGAAQVGLILAKLMRLSEIEQAMVFARFAPKVEVCPCCGGDRETPEWRHAVERLAAWCIPATVSHMRVRRELIAKYFGVKRVEFTTLAALCGLNRKTVAEHYAVIEKRLRGAERSAQSVIDDLLRESGMVGEMENA